MVQATVAATSTSRKRRFAAIGCALAVIALGLWTVRARVAASSKIDGAQSASKAAGHGATGRRHGVGGSHGRDADGRRGRDEELVLVRGTVVDADTGEGVGGGEVVFSGGGSPKTTRADDSGHYQIEVNPGAYRPFVRGDGYVSAGLPARERLVRPPSPSAVGLAHDDLAPLVVIADDEAGVNLRVERSGLVTGKVSNKVGDPIAGAMVRARGSRRPIAGTDIAETAADGSFKLQLPFGGYRIEVSHEEYAGIGDSQASIVVQPDVRREPLALTLLAGCIVRGTVVGPSGAPLGEGSVDERGPTMSDFRPSSSIEADGTFRFTTVEDGDVALRAWPWMSPPTTPETVHCSEGARPEVTLKLADDGKPDLDGTLVTSSGEPAAGAFLDIIALTPGGESQEERADAYGKWEVYAMPAGVYEVSITVEGEGSVQRRVTVPSHDIALTLSGTGSIGGALKGVDDGTIGMTVSGCADDPVAGYPHTRLVTVRDGRFQLDGVPACRVSIGVQKGTNAAQASVAVVKNGVAQASLDLTPPPPVAIEPVPEPAAPEPVAIAPEVISGPADPPDPAPQDEPEAQGDDEVGGGAPDN